MKLFTSPEPIVQNEDFLSEKSPIIFLAGSIEQGKAVDWQEIIINALKDIDCIILNPRRKQWDATWVQSIDNPKFKEQVLWELNGIKESDIVVIYFDKNTKSPITLLELGLSIGMNKKIIVYCPEGFYRKGNIDITCELFDQYVFEDENEFLKALKQLI